MPPTDTNAPAPAYPAPAAAIPTPPTPECPSESELFTERNRFFTGKYMTARDFRDEQRFFLSHHRWHQWTLHGWGIVWGLKVTMDEERQCLCIHPGMAIDCHGRDLVLDHAIHVAIAEVVHPAAAAAGAQQQPAGDDFLIGVRYTKIPCDLVPVLLDDCPPLPKDTHNRVKEHTRIWWEKYDPNASPNCWDYPHLYLPAKLPEPPPATPAAAPPPPSPVCIDGAWTVGQHNHPDEHDCRCHDKIEMHPPCECGDCGFVPIVRLKRHNGVWEIDDLGCRYVPSPFYGEALTHIVGINWTHAGMTRFQHLLNNFEMPRGPEELVKVLHDTQQRCHGIIARIVVYFDRPLSAELVERLRPVAASIYLAQLVRLEYVELNRWGNPDDLDLDGDDPPKPITPKCVHLSECRTKLYCDFPAHRVKNDLPVRMRFSLNCDMLVDERGRAVDGEHLGGHVPNHYTTTFPWPQIKTARSGNGIEGGTFTSWTELIPEQR